eukprot:m.426192 g.426192  ORF g.426192 m.426192 type:complete len:170 (+) comp56684_c0_seq33:42-551(+)
MQAVLLLGVLTALAAAAPVADPFPLFPPADVCRQSFRAAPAFREGVGVRVAAASLLHPYQCISYETNTPLIDRNCQVAKPMWWQITDGQVHAMKTALRTSRRLCFPRYRFSFLPRFSLDLFPAGLRLERLLVPAGGIFAPAAGPTLKLSDAASLVNRCGGSLCASGRSP